MNQDPTTLRLARICFAQTLVVLIDTQSNHGVSYFQENKAAEEGKRNTGRDRYRLSQ